MPRAAPLRRKLALFFALAFVVGTSLILVLTLGNLERSLKERDLADLRSKAQDLVAVYRLGGLIDLRRDVAINDLLANERPFLVRVATSDNRTLFASVPRQWSDFDFSIIERNPVPDPSELTILTNTGVPFEIEILTVPINPALFVQVGGSNQARTRTMDIVVASSVIVSIPVLIAIVIAVGFLARRILRPVGDVVTLAQRAIETGAYDQSLPVRGHSREMDELATVINRLMRMVSDLVSNLRATIDSVAHDLRTPVTRMRTRAEITLREDATEQELREALEAAVEESQEITAFLSRLLQVSQAESGMLTVNMEECNLAALIREVVEVYDYLAEERGITIDLSAPDALVCRADAGWLKQAVGNLLDNAVKYSPEGSKIEVGLSRRDPGPSAAISVRDRGPGIPEDELPRIWERQFRGSAAAGVAGHGLGLPIVRAVARAHGGRVTAEQRPEGGMDFRICLPLAPD